MAKTIFIMWVSGSGKTSVLKESWLLEREDMQYIPSWTTRPMRPGEINGEKYHHVDENAFKKAIENNDFLEYTIVHNQYRYGTPRVEILNVLAQGKNPIKELEMLGLMKIKENHEFDNKYFSLFIDIPIEMMEERIRKRWPIDDLDLRERISSALFEKRQAQSLCDCIIDGARPLAKVVEKVILCIEQRCS